MNIKTMAAGIATLALAAGLTTGLASTASASTPPCFIPDQCAAAPSIKITGASISTPPGYYPTPAGPIIDATSSAQFSNAGTQVTDFRLLVDGKLVPENDTYFGSGSVGVLYGADPGISISTEPSLPGMVIPGTAFPVSPGRHVLTTEVVGVGGAVLASSAGYTVTVPEQAAATKPKLTYTASNNWTYGGYLNQGQITISSATTAVLDAPSSVLTFTLPAGVTLDPDNNPGVTQSGTTVTITGSGNIYLAGINSYGAAFDYDGAELSPLTIGSVTLDGIPVSLG
jgi:hypothetical protein